MKLLRPFVLLALLAGMTAALQAQSPKVVFVDLAEIYDSHHKKIAMDETLRAEQATAQARGEELNTQGNDLVARYQEQLQIFESEESTEEQKGAALTKGEELLQQIQTKQQEVAVYRQNSAQYFQNRIQAFRNELLGEIREVAATIAQRHNADFLFDTAGPSMLGVPSLLYAKDAHDITAEVVAEIVKLKDEEPTVSVDLD